MAHRALMFAKLRTTVKPLFERCPESVAAKDRTSQGSCEYGVNTLDTGDRSPFLLWRWWSHATHPWFECREQPRVAPGGRWLVALAEDFSECRDVGLPVALEGPFGDPGWTDRLAQHPEGLGGGKVVSPRQAGDGSPNDNLGLDMPSGIVPREARATRSGIGHSPSTLIRRLALSLSACTPSYLRR